MNTVLSPKPDSELNGLTAHLLNRADTSSLFSYTYKGEHKRMTFQNLHNGMKFVLTVPVREVDAKSNELLQHIGIFSLSILVVALVWTYIATTRLVGPLRELNTAAHRIANGELDVHIRHQSNDEVGALADSFRLTASKLRKYIHHVNALAYKDALTGCKNSAAYMEAHHRLDEQIQSGTAHFGVLIFDLNDLKRVNDTLGHNFGDIIIKAAAKIICATFKHSPVYRIGGDEFAVVLEGTDLLHEETLLPELPQAMAAWNEAHSDRDLEVSLAWGLAVYDIMTDRTFQDVAKRADALMYQHKSFLKRERALRRRAEAQGTAEAGLAAAACTRED